MKSYTTQMHAARQGIITPQMEAGAQKENLSAEQIRALLARGQAVICANKGHENLEPQGIGSSPRTKINVNVGASRDCRDYELELRKVKEALRLGAEAIMDLYSHGETKAFRRQLINLCPAPIGSVPIYDSVIHYQKELEELKGEKAAA